MNSTKQNNDRILAILISVTVVLAALAFVVSNRSYGKVSPHAYEISKAIYSACLSRSPDRIEKIKSILSTEPTDNLLPKKEHRWLNEIVNKAIAGKWESAASAAKTLLEDQVDN